MPQKMPTHLKSPKKATALAVWKITSIQDYLILLRERWMAALAIALLISVVFGYHGYTQPKIYQATSLLQLNQSVDRVVDMKEVVDQSIRSYSLIDTYVQQIRSTSFIQYVAKNLTEEEINKVLTGVSTTSDQDRRAQAARIIGRASTPKHKASSPIITVSAESDNREVAAFISQKVTQEYTKYVLEKNSVSNSSAIEFLKNQVETLRIKIEDGDRALQNYRKSNNLVSLEENQNIIVERLKSLNQALGDTKLERLAIETKVKQVDNYIDSDADMTSLKVITSHGSIQSILVDLDTLNNKRLTLNEKYFEKHPKMVVNASEIDALKQQLKQSIQLATSDLRNQLAETVDKQNQIEIALKSAEQDSFELDRLGVEYDVIRRKVENEKRTFDQLFSRLNETHITSQLNNSNLKILDLAKGAKVIRPIPKTITFHAAILFLMFFLGIPLVLEFFRNKAMSTWDIEQFLGQNYLCGFPKTKGNLDYSHIFNGENEVIAESFRSLLSQVLMEGDFGKPLTILFTSTLPGEGKSFTSSTLAACAARHGKKTLIIDCDFRRPSQHNIFKQPNDTGSLSWLTESSELGISCDTSKLGIIELEKNLALLPPGGTTNRPTELIQCPRFKQMLEAVKAEYEFILIDASPVSLFSESLFLSQYADSTLYICQHNKINRNNLKHCLTMLKEHNAEILGIIFNQVKSHSSSSDSYGYSYGNYKEQQKYYKAYKS